MNLENTVLQVHVEDIIPNRFQPRLNFDEQGLQELSDSIKEHGIIQPLVLRKLGNKYEIIAGERRYKAAQMAGLTTVPAVIANIDDNKSAEVALVENVQRRDLTAIEEARSYKSLLDKGYLTQDQLAKRMGLSQPSVANKLRLLNLDEEVQEALLAEKISERHARTLLGIQDKEEQREWLHRIINERLTVRQLDLEIKKSKGDIPLVSEHRSVEDIKANAVDINSRPDKLSADELLKPQQIVTEEVEQLDLTEPIEETFTPATSVSEFNIATPNSASTFVGEETFMETPPSQNTFFTYSGPSEEEPEMTSTTSVSEKKLEVFDAPTYENSFIEHQPEETEEDEAPASGGMTYENDNNNYNNELSANNTFFTPIVERKEIELINRKEETVNPMDAVEKLSPEYNQAARESSENNLKEAITNLLSQSAVNIPNFIPIFERISQIRSCIQNLGNKGFYINVEEIDFDKNYQITIQINKDN